MGRIPFNPYIVGNPICSREMFFGREDDFQYVVRKGYLRSLEDGASAPFSEEFGRFAGLFLKR
jgi:hypothetical protein